MKEDHQLREKSIPKSSACYTEKQGQYLAFIHYYSKINRQPPAEADMQRFFRVSPPSVHRILVDLERKKLIAKTPGQARSIRLLLPPQQLPELL